LDLFGGNQTQAKVPLSIDCRTYSPSDTAITFIRSQTVLEYQLWSKKLSGWWGKGPHIVQSN